MARRGRGKCKRITFKKKNGRKLPKSKWVTVTRCEGRSLKGHNKRQCKRGGSGPNAFLFAKCPSRGSRKKLFSYKGKKVYLRPVPR